MCEKCMENTERLVTGIGGDYTCYKRENKLKRASAET